MPPSHNVASELPIIKRLCPDATEHAARKLAAHRARGWYLDHIVRIGHRTYYVEGRLSLHCIGGGFRIRKHLYL